MKQDSLSSSFKKSVAIGGQQSVGKSNAFELVITKSPSIVYRYDVEITKINERKQKSLTAGGDTSVRTLQRQTCSDIIHGMHIATEGFKNNCLYVYDGRSILYTNKEVNVQGVTRLESTQLRQRAAQFVRNDPVEVSIMPNKEYYKLDYSDLNACLVGDVAEQADRSARSFFEMVTSQQFINDDTYQQVGAGTLFGKHTIPLTDNRNSVIHGMDLRVGLKKGARVTAHATPKAFLFVDLKRTAFFSTDLMSELYTKMLENRTRRDEYERFFRGVRMQVTYDPSRSFLFGSLSAQPISHSLYKVNGQTIPQYYQTNKNITLRSLTIPGVHPDQPNGHTIIYPLELIRPIEGQLVPVEKLTTFAVRVLLAENSMLPDARYNYISQQVKKIAESTGASFLNGFNLKLIMDSNKATICANPLPKISVGGMTITAKPNGSWNDDAVKCKLLCPSNKLTSWMVGFDRTALGEPSVRAYIKSLLAEAIKSGLNLPEPKCYVSTQLASLENDLFVKGKADKVQFIFYIDDMRSKSHGRLKLFEAFYKILTQQVIEKNLKNGPQTLKNVLLKLNVKAFGLNYIPILDSPMLKNLKLESPDLLVIGYDISPPDRMSGKEIADFCRRNKLDPATKVGNIHPASVAICANKGFHPYAFSGDFFYQEADGGLIDPEKLQKAVANIVQSSFKMGRKPTRVIVFRDGVSEGEQARVAKMELPAIRKGWVDGAQRTQEAMNCKITFVVGTKAHFKRFYRMDGQRINNTRVGDSIRMDAIRSDIHEVYVQAHHPLKGMPKVPQYAVLANELNIERESLESFIIFMSNMHQVSACPTSLPLPIYMADELCKRADEIYKALLFFRESREGGRFAPEITFADGKCNYETLNKALSYAGHPLYGTRFNA